MQLALCWSWMQANSMQLALGGWVGRAGNYKKAPQHRMHPNPLCVFGAHQMHFSGGLRWREFWCARANAAHLRWREY